MPIKVRNNWNGEEYLLVGTGFGVSSSSSQPNAGMMLGMPQDHDGRVEMVALCDREGAIIWSRSRDIDVVEVDGKPPSEWLS